MKQEVKIVKDLKLYLKLVIEPILRNPQRLYSGRPLSNIKLLPREIVGLFLICVVGSVLDKDNKWSIASDAEGRDGVVICTAGKREGEAFATEQTYVFKENKGWLSSLVLKRIKQKSSKGLNYGKDRHLIIFIDKKGKLNWKRIMQNIKTNNVFNSIWLFGKYNDKKWSYFVMTIKTTTDPLGAYKVTINNNFNNWKVELLGKLSLDI